MSRFKSTVLSLAFIAVLSACQETAPNGGSADVDYRYVPDQYNGLLRKVALYDAEGGGKTILANDIHEAYFFFVVFSGMEGKYALVRYDTLSPSQLDVKVEGMSTPSKWSLLSMGDINITQGNKTIYEVRAGSIVDYSIITAGIGSGGAGGDLDARLTTLETELSSLSSSLIDNDTGRVTQLEEDRDGLTNRINDLETETIPGLENELSGLRDLLDDITSLGDDGSLADLISRINTLETWKSNAATELTSLRNDLGSVNASLTGTNALLDTAVTELSSLSTTTSGIRTELDAAKANIDALLANQSSGAPLITEITALSGTISSADVFENAFAYVTFAGQSKGEFVTLATLTTDDTFVGPEGASQKSKWKKPGSGEVTYTTVIVNPAIDGLYLGKAEAQDALKLQNARYNTIAQNLSALEISVSEEISGIKGRLDALEEGLGASMLPSSILAKIKVNGFAYNSAVASDLYTFFSAHRGRRYFFMLENEDWGEAKNPPRAGALTAVAEVAFVGDTLSCELRISKIDTVWQSVSCYGAWSLTNNVFDWQTPASSENGWTALSAQDTLSVGVKTWDSGDQTNGRVIVKLSGNFWNCTVKPANKNFTTTAQTIATIPEAFRNKSEHSAMVQTNDNWTQGAIQMLSTGEVKISSTSTVYSGKAYDFSEIWDNPNPAHILSVNTIDFTNRITGALWTGASSKLAQFDPLSGLVIINYFVPGSQSWADANSPVVPDDFLPETTAYGMAQWDGSTASNNSYVKLDRTSKKIRFMYAGSQYTSTGDKGGAISLSYIIPKRDGAFIIQKPKKGAVVALTNEKTGQKMSQLFGITEPAFIMFLVNATSFNVNHVTAGSGATASFSESGTGMRFVYPDDTITVSGNNGTQGYVVLGGGI